MKSAELEKTIVRCALRMCALDAAAASYDRRLRVEEDPRILADLNLEYSTARAEAIAAREEIRCACAQLELAQD